MIPFNTSQDAFAWLADARADYCTVLLKFREDGRLVPYTDEEIWRFVR